MKLLYVSQYFHPEIGAPTNRALANVRHLANQGHEVTVLTEMPNHPKGIIFEGYKHKLFCREKFENFFINRVWIYTNPKKNFITRILFYITFPVMAVIHTLLNWKRYDVIYVSSPPLFVGITGIALKTFFKKSKFIFELRDLWPHAAVEMGALKSRQLIKFSYKLEKKLYNTADHIVAVTERFKTNIIERGFDGNKISVVRNGSDLEFEHQPVSEKMKSKYLQNNSFIVLYAGNLGIAQNLTTILKAANELKTENILFLMVGSGPEEKLLKDFASKNELNNVVFTGLIPKEEMNQYLSIADCGLIPLKNIPVFERTIPSKLFDYMSADLPILLGVKGEAKEILETAHAGIAFEPDDHNDLSKKIMYLKNNENELSKLKGKGRNFIIEHFDRRKLAEQLEKVILDVAGK